ncbi:MAG: hypothetical protein AMJ84_00180 [Acidithiobacillales bacterium SM23_46]|nr:MAG: hypothetical protein AMJ84_00180 [Acidithiobacillales bacterium SM23_46]KPL29027.1 MAG: hypothetical protein AMJ72_00270 [Acidithiobacillales bacterium SM1_46]
MTAQKNFRSDSFVSGLAIKAPCQHLATTPITLSGEYFPYSVGDRVLVTAQADPIQNGIWVCETSAWQRAGDFDGNRDLVGGTLVPVDDGAGALVLYQLDGAIAEILEPDVDALTFTLYLVGSGGGGGDDLQAVTTVGNTTDQGIVIQTGASLIIQTPDNLDTITFRVNDTEQPFPFLEVLGSAAVEVMRFNEPFWSTGNGIFISGVGTRRFAFYGYGDAIEGSIAQDGSSNITVTALGDFEIITGGNINLNSYPILDFTIKQQTVIANGGGITINYALGQSVWLIVNQDIPSITFSNLPISGELAQMEIEVLMNGPQRTITWPVSFEWPGGNALPDPAPNDTALLAIRSRDGGSTWLATFAEAFA